MPGRKLLPLVVLIALVSFLMTWQARRGPLNPLAGVDSAFYGLSGGIGTAVSRTGDLFRNLTTGKDDIKVLEDRIAMLKRQNDQMIELKKENERLKALLDLKQHTPACVASANVVARGARHWANTVIIDAGSAQGVQKDMAVITPQGLVGKVMRAGREYSSVLLINDIRFSVAARFQESRVEAIVSGTGGSGCMLKYFPYDQAVKKGDVLISSGLDGLFPEGLKVGWVSGLGPDEGLFKNAEVVPFVNPAAVEEVMIIKR